jgi:hypothetical protein
MARPVTYATDLHAQNQHPKLEAFSRLPNHSVAAQRSCNTDVSILSYATYTAIKQTIILAALNKTQALLVDKWRRYAIHRKIKDRLPFCSKKSQRKMYSS